MGGNIVYVMTDGPAVIVLRMLILFADPMAIGFVAFGVCVIMDGPGKIVP